MIEPEEQIEIQGKILVCPHCEGKEFMRSSAQLNTMLLTFFDLDWLDHNAEIFICSSCGRIEWFFSQFIPPRDKMQEATDCLSCGCVIPAGTSACPQCRWTYKT